MMNCRHFAGLILVLALAGCGRKEPPTPAPAPEKPPAAVSVEAPSPDAPPPPQAAAEAAPVAPSTAPVDDNSVGADLGNTYVADLQSIVDSYVAVTKRKPADFAQIISAGFMPAMPPAPAGKKYLLDPATAKVKLVNR